MSTRSRFKGQATPFLIRVVMFATGDLIAFCPLGSLFSEYMYKIFLNSYIALRLLLYFFALFPGVFVLATLFQLLTIPVYLGL